jgi:hypothetical protein
MGKDQKTQLVIKIRFYKNNSGSLELLVNTATTAVNFIRTSVLFILVNG